MKHSSNDYISAQVLTIVHHICSAAYSDKNSLSVGQVASNGDPFTNSENSKLKHCTPDYRLSSSILWHTGNYNVHVKKMTKTNIILAGVRAHTYVSATVIVCGCVHISIYHVWYRSVSYAPEFIVMCVCVFFRIILYVNCFGRTVLYMCGISYLG